MTFTELLIIAVGLSMDAFAVSIGKGLSLDKVKKRHAISAGLWFGGFQALMPILGYLLGASFSSLVSSVDHWIAFVLLGLIGANMIREALSNDGDDHSDADFSTLSMLLLSIATSIDALAVGVTFAFLGEDIVISATIIGVTTFFFSIAGIKIGNFCGSHYKSKAELLGGCILVLIGLKILLEHICE